MSRGENLCPEIILYFNLEITLRTEKTSFHSLMENMETIPVFGTSFTIYIPILMILIAIITLFDGFARLLNLLGIESEESIIVHKLCGKNSTELESGLLEKYQHGKMLVNHELNVRRLHASSNQNEIRGIDSPNTLQGIGNNLYRVFFPASNPYNVLEKVNPLHAVDDDQDIATGAAVGVRKEKVFDTERPSMSGARVEIYGNRFNHKAAPLSSKVDESMKYFDIEEKEEGHTFRGRYSD